MPITPDDKDWTWVLQRPCPECGFDSSTIDVASVGALIRANALQWQELLATREGVRTRPDDSTWSPLEYACHVRDVFALYETRLTLMLTVDDARFANWDQDQTAVEEEYDRQEPAAVAVELADNARVLADHFDDVSGDQWMRTGLRSDGAQFTVETFARYLIHDPVHHMWDVNRQL